jgi:hypothetical protein
MLSITELFLNGRQLPTPLHQQKPRQKAGFYVMRCYTMACSRSGTALSSSSFSRAVSAALRCFQRRIAAFSSFTDALTEGWVFGIILDD